MNRFGSLTCLSLCLAVAVFLESVAVMAEVAPVENYVYLPDLSNETLRALPRPQRREYKQIKMLERVMLKEGPEFSQEKLDRYNLSFGLGLTATILGGGTMLAGVLLAALSAYDLGLGGEEDPEEEEARHSLRIAGVSTAIGGAVALCVAVPFLIHGKWGRFRQQQLRQKYKTLAPLRYERWKLALLHDREGQPAGLSISVIF